MIFSKPLYYITKVRDHHISKEKILSMISKIDGRYDDGISKISNTDWLNQQNGVVFDWYTYSLSERDRESYVKLIHKKFGKNKSSINTIWFNQYDSNSGTEHKMHSHYDDVHRNDLANIYYVELKDKSLRTILKHPKTGKEIVPRVKEGQILTFDARIKHKSPPNHTDTRKTVISFNTLFLE